MNTLEKFSWIPFYEEFADKLLLYKNKRLDLLKILEEVFTHPDINNPFTNQGELIDDICPFTVIGSFNRGLTDKNRILIATEIGKRIGIESSIPTDFDGIPLLNNQQAWFFRFKTDRSKDDIDNLWEMFEIAIHYANNQSKFNENKFIEYFNIMKEQPLVKWNLTMGLFWIRPLFYMNLDTKNREYILNERSVYKNVAKISKLKDLPFADEYLEIINHFKSQFTKPRSIHKNFPELSYNAWKNPFKERKTWIYSPGRNAINWDEFYAQGIMAIGWDKLKNLEGYSSKNQIKEKMKQLYDENLTYVNDALATWQFAKEMSIDDIVYVKKGKSTILGYGIVKSEYIYDEKRENYQHTRKVEWKVKGEWNNPRKEVNKTLTEITSNVEEITKLQDLFINNIYTKANFLSEVFMDETSYDRLVKILKMKKT